jgi:uncharacterized membrane protein YkoI
MLADMIKTIASLLSVAVLLTAAQAYAGDNDHERARRAVEAGEALPLKTVLERVGHDFPGDVIETELEDWHGRAAYEIKVITPEGNVVKLFYDARDGTLLHAKGRGAERKAKP